MSQTPSGICFPAECSQSDIPICLARQRHLDKLQSTEIQRIVFANLCFTTAEEFQQQPPWHWDRTARLEFSRWASSYKKTAAFSRRSTRYLQRQQSSSKQQPGHQKVARSRCWVDLVWRCSSIRTPSSITISVPNLVSSSQIICIIDRRSCYSDAERQRGRTEEPNLYSSSQTNVNARTEQKWQPVLGCKPESMTPPFLTLVEAEMTGLDRVWFWWCVCLCSDGTEKLARGGNSLREEQPELNPDYLTRCADCRFFRSIRFSLSLPPLKVSFWTYSHLTRGTNVTKKPEQSSFLF